jgi:hypothetical protein
MISNRVSMTASSTGLSYHTVNSTTTVHQEPDDVEETKEFVLPPIPIRWRSESTASHSAHSRTYNSIAQGHRNAVCLPGDRSIVSSHSAPNFRQPSPPTRLYSSVTCDTHSSVRHRAWGANGTDFQFTPRQTSPLAESLESDFGYFTTQRPTGLGITCAGSERERGARLDDSPFYIS